MIYTDLEEREIKIIMEFGNWELGNPNESLAF